MIETNEHYKLSNIMGALTNIVNDVFPHPIWIEAEIISINKHNQSGHYYLELAETDTKGNEICKNKASIWASKANTIINKFKTNTGSDLKAGLKVLLRCKISFHAKHHLSISIEDINPEFTLGGMEVKIKEIIARLEKQNIINLNKSLSSPFDFHNVAVIAPSGAAGLGDFKKDADILVNYNVCQFDYYEAIFQGKETNFSVSNAISKALNSGIDYDAIIVIRGGGSKTDLHFLNEYEIAATICKSTIPVFVGVGHERDKGVLDHVANTSFDTPSKVIGYIFSVITNNAHLIRNNITSIFNTSSKLTINRKNEVDKSYSLINANANRLIEKYKSDTMTSYLSIKNSSIFKLEDFENKTNGSIDRILIHSKNKIQNYKDSINAKHIMILEKGQNLILNIFKDIDANVKIIEGFKPDYIMNLGFIIAKKDGKVVKDISEIQKDDVLKLVFKNGSIKVQVQEI